MDEQLLSLSGQSPTPGYDVPSTGYLAFTVTVADGATVSGTVLVDQSFDFAWFRKSAVWTSPNFTMQFTYPDGTRQQQLEPAAAETVLGKGAFPVLMNPGYLCRGGQRIQYQITNNSGAPNTIRVTLGGVLFRAR
jgi:hypothetical protein